MAVKLKPFEGNNTFWESQKVRTTPKSINASDSGYKAVKDLFQTKAAKFSGLDGTKPKGVYTSVTSFEKELSSQYGNDWETQVDPLVYGRYSAMKDSRAKNRPTDVQDMTQGKHVNFDLREAIRGCFRKKPAESETKRQESKEEDPGEEVGQVDSTQFSSRASSRSKNTCSPILLSTSIAVCCAAIALGLGFLYIESKI